MWRGKRWSLFGGNEIFVVVVCKLLHCWFCGVTVKKELCEKVVGKSLMRDSDCEEDVLRLICGYAQQSGRSVE